MKKLDEILKNKRIWGHEAMWFMAHSARVTLPDCGTCSVIWSDCEDGMEHVSVSPKKQFRIPSWDDMCVLKDIFFEDEEEAYQIHPKKSQYVNAVENCLHLWKPKGHEIDELTKQTRWISVDEKLPDPDELILLSFENFTVPMIGRYTVDDDDPGTFRVGDTDDSFVENDLYVNAWMPLPEPWRGE